LLIATEMGPALDTNALPDELFISVVTIADLQAGVLAAADTPTRARRMATLDCVSELEALPIDVVAAGHWDTLRVRLAEEGRRINVPWRQPMTFRSSRRTVTMTRWRASAAPW